MPRRAFPSEPSFVQIVRATRPLARLEAGRLRAHRLGRYAVTVISLMGVFGLLASVSSGANARSGQLDNSFRGGVSTLRGLDAIFGGSLVGDRRGRLTVFASVPRECPPDNGCGALVGRRFLADGAPDNTFALGWLPLELKGISSSAVALDEHSYLVAASTRDVPDQQHPVVIRYLPDGRIDTSFGVGGIAEIPLAGPVSTEQVSVQADGRIVVGGTLSPDDADTATAFLVRLNPDGTIDQTFAEEGIRVLPGPFGYFAKFVFTRHQGILVASNRKFPECCREASSRIVALDAAGGPDRSLGETASIRINGRLQDLLPVSSGGFLTLSQRTSTRERKSGRTPWPQILARWHRNGAPDRRFGRGGKQVIQHRGFIGGHLYRDGDGRLLIVGSSELCFYPDDCLFEGSIPSVLRLLPAGTVDRGFAQNGLAKVHLPGGGNELSAGAYFGAFIGDHGAVTIGKSYGGCFRECTVRSFLFRLRG